MYGSDITILYISFLLPVLIHIASAYSFSENENKRFKQKTAYFLLFSSWSILASALAALSSFLAAESCLFFSSIYNTDTQGFCLLMTAKRPELRLLMVILITRTLVCKLCMDFSKVFGGALWWLQRTATARFALLYERIFSGMLSSAVTIRMKGF